MKLKRALFGLLVIGLLPASFALADIPPTPRDLPPGKNYERLEVKVDAAKDMSFLRIPRSALNDAGLDFRDKKSSKVGTTSPSTTRSIVAALALSLGVAGVFFTRRKRGAMIAVALVSTTIVGAMGMQAWGNAAPLPIPRNDAEAAGIKNFRGNVVIQIVEDGDVELTIGTKPLPVYKRALPPGAPNPSSELRT